MGDTQDLKKIIRESSLSPDEQFEFILICKNLSEEDASSMLELFTNDSSWIEKMYKNYTEKYKAFELGGKGKMKKILDSEMNELKYIV